MNLMVGLVQVINTWGDKHSNLRPRADFYSFLGKRMEKTVIDFVWQNIDHCKLM